MTKLLSLAAFAAGLATVGWVGAGYLHAQPLALAIIVLIAAFYLLGSWELLRFARTTQALSAALHGLSQTPARLDDWLATLPGGLRDAVRQRVEGARTGLPGPVLASYLTGLLVLLGMLGTFGGMVVALNGTGAALAGADGLDAMRDALSAPVRGLGLAFGTSVAGVAASAMLGLMTALCRRERIQAARQLDAATAGLLRPFSSQHQREASLRLLEQQTGVMPQVVSGLQDCMAALERQQLALGERLAAEQQRFYRETESTYTTLAATVQRTLADTAAECAQQSAAQAGAAIRPATEATLAALARESTRLQEAMAQQVGRQLDAMATRFGDATSAVSTQWTSALAEHRSTGAATAQALGDALARFTQGFEQRTAELARDMAQRLSQQSDAQAARWDAALDRQTGEGERLAERQQQALQAATDNLAHLAERFGETTGAVSTQWTSALAEHRSTGAATAQALGDALARFTQGFEQRTAELAGDLAQRLSQQSDTQATRWDAALERQTSEGERLAERQQQALQAATDHLAHLAARFGEATSAVSSQWTSALAEHRSTGAATAQALGDALARFTQGFEQRTADLAGDLARRLAQQSDAQAARWDAALLRQSSDGARLATQQQQALQAATDGLAQHAGALQATVDQAHQGLQSRLAAQEEQRLAQWTHALQSVASALTDEWRQAGAQAAAQQQQTGDALAQAAADIARHMQAQAQGTLAEVQQLVHAAAEAPRAAAQAMGALRQQISDSIARDNAMLDERARLLETLSTLLGAAGRAADEQRSAIDALVAQAAGSMERAGGQFAHTLDAQAARLEGLAAQVAAGATEVASLGDAFGGAVQLFGQASEQMLAQLQRIEAAMAKSLARSDEQLDYYVAQAREVIELSVGAQKQIIDGLQLVAAQRAEEAVQ